MASRLGVRVISRSSLSPLPETLDWKQVNRSQLRLCGSLRTNRPYRARPITTCCVIPLHDQSKRAPDSLKQARSWCGSRKSVGKTAAPAQTHLSNIRSSSSVTSPPGTETPDSTPPIPAPPTITHPPYTPPTTGLISHLPASWIPYAELIRLDKPTGTYYLFFPCLFSTLLAAPHTTPAITPPLTILGTTLLFLTGALIMRGAGCTINDLWDRNLDPHVTRTRHRPLARRAITPRAALMFTSAQLLTGLAILVQFPPLVIPYAIPSLLLVGLYPLAKRVTHYPQFVLGLTFSWGAILGFPALGIDLLSAANADLLTAAAFLYASCVSWTVLYDMIYAHMDVRDDAAAGIKSIALRHRASTKAVLSGLAVMQVSLLAGAGWAVGAGPVFFGVSCGGAAVSLGLMVRRVKLEDVRDCWWWFRNGCWFTGGVIGVGLAGEYAVRLGGWYWDGEKGMGSRKNEEGEEEEGR